jgi:hypothetical protein
VRQPTKEFEIRRSTDEEAHEGRVWILDPQERTVFEGHRRIVRITHNGKNVYCEALYADEHYLTDRYKKGQRPPQASDQKLVFINRWFRQQLGIDVDERVQLTIKVCRNPFHQFLATAQHPQVVVRLATALGILGLGLGVLSIGLAVLGMQEFALRVGFGWTGILLGAATCIPGCWLLISR